MPIPVSLIETITALSLNLAIWLGAEIQQLLSYQDMARFHGNDGWMLPIPAVFVVGRDGSRTRILEPHPLADGESIMLGDFRLTYIEVERDEA